jgi:hypothetical protein
VILDVGVLALPLVKRERGLAEGLERVLSLGGSRGLVRSRSSGSGSSGSGLLLGLLLGLLGLLGGSVGKSGGLEELDLLSNLREDGLGADSLEPSGDGGVLLAPLLVKEVLEAASGDANSEEISKGDALANEEGVADEMLLNNGESLQGSLGSIVDVLLVVGSVALEGTEPSDEAGKDLRVEEGHPLQDRSIVLLGLAEESGLLVLGGDVDGNGNALRQSETVLANEGGDLAKTVGLEVLSVGVALLGLDDVELDVVRLSDSADGCRTAVVLEEPRTSQ